MSTGLLLLLLLLLLLWDVGMYMQFRAVRSREAFIFIQARFSHFYFEIIKINLLMSRGVRAKETLVPYSFFQRRRMSRC